ncbi:MAG: DUF885 family protein [Gemmatimonadota bacterium]
MIHTRRRPAAAPVLSVALASVLLAGACGAPEGGGGASESGEEAVTEALALAAEYVEAYFRQFPEEALSAGYPDADLDRLGDHGPEARAAWRAREDAWLARARALDADAVAGTDAAVPFGYLRERLEASVGRRICRVEEWNVSPTWTGWQNGMAFVFSAQPVGTPEHREAALARARDLPRWLEDEVRNLREGLAAGYSAPKGNVRSVIEQMDALLAVAPESSPFFSPAERDSTPAFRDSLLTIIADEIDPAIAAYRGFLTSEYLPAAREAIGVTSDPGGRDCYLAEVRYYTSLPLTPEEIHETGLRQMERIQAELREIGRRSFGTEDTRALLQRVRTDPRYTFKSRAEIVEYAQAAVNRAKAAIPDWFGFVPKAEVVIRPYSPFQEKSAPGAEYSSGSEDGSRPATYLINTYEPTKQSRAGVEATAFHETYPGHHMQGSVALERGGVNPILRYFFNSGFGEGWALYSERLSDEMGLYSDDLARVGLLSNEALRAARLVVDAGMHALGWDRQRAIDYVLAHTAESPARAAAEIDRYIAVPGQATSYMTGNLEIRRLRELAESRLGDRFDVKAFHDRVLEDGTISLGMLREKMEAWVEEEAGGS